MAFASVVLPSEAKAQGVPSLPQDPEVRVGKLDNGLTYIIRRNTEPEGRASFYIAQRVGSMQEEESQRGLAHFLEHMAFNGTKNFPGKSMINWLQTIGVRFGSNLNAYTGFDETLYMIMDAPVARQTVVDSCLLILHDWSCGISLEEKEIDNERGVIQEEWRQRDNGNMRAFTQVLEKAFAGNRYGQRMPIGTMDVVRNFKYDEIRSYYKKWYRPDLQALVIVGDIDPDNIEATIKKQFADVPKPVNPAERTSPEVAAHEGILAIVATDPEATGVRFTIDFKHDPMPKELKGTQMELLQNFLTDVISSMFNQRMSEITQKPNAPFLNASASYGDFIVARTKDALSFGVVAHEGKAAEAINALMAEIERVRQHGFTAGEYKRAVADFMVGQKKAYDERSKRRNGTYAQQYSDYFFRGGALASVEDVYKTYEQLTPMVPVEAINQTIKQLISKDDIVAYLMAPTKEGVTYPTEAELVGLINTARQQPVEAYKDSVSDEKLMETKPKAGKIVSEKKNDKFGTTEWTLSNGVKVVYKTTDFKNDEISMRGSRPGGTLLYDAKEAKTLALLNSLTGLGGVGKFSSTDLDKVLSGRIASANLGLNDLEETVSGASTVADLETMLQLMYLKFTDLRRDDEAFAAFKQQIHAMRKMQASNPMASLGDSIQKALYESNPYHVSLLGLSDQDVDNIDYARALEIFRERFSDASGFQFFFVGNIDPAQLRPLVETYIASLPANKKAKHVRPEAKLPRLRRSSYTNHYSKKMETPASVVVTTWTGDLPVNQRSRMAMGILSEVLDQVYTETLREEEGGTYGASTDAGISYRPKDEASLQVFFRTDPEKALMLKDVVRRDIDNILKNGIPTDKFDKVIANLEKQHSENLKQNGYWMGVISTFYTEDGRDLHSDYLKHLKAITPAEVQGLLRQLVGQNNYIELILSPEK